MGDTKISALTAVGSVVDAQEFAVNDGGTSKKATALQIKAYTRPRLSSLPLNGTYGDDFAASSLDARWTKHNIVTCDLTFQDGGGSWMSALPQSGHADQSIFQSYTPGVNEFVVAQTNFQTTSTGLMVGPMIVDASGNGVGCCLYDNAVGFYLFNIASYAYSSTLGTPFTNGNWGDQFQIGAQVWYSLKDNNNGTYTTRFSLNGLIWSPSITATPSAFTANRVGWGRFLGTPTTGTHAIAIDIFNKA